MSTNDTATAPRLTTGQLVCWNVTSDNRSVRVLADAELARLVVTTELADAGWQLAEFDNTGCRVLVRATGVTTWLQAWGTEVVRVQVANVETGVEQGAVVAQLGEVRSTRAVARVDGLAR